MCCWHTIWCVRRHRCRRTRDLTCLCTGAVRFGSGTGVAACDCRCAGAPHLRAAVLPRLAHRGGARALQRQRVPHRVGLGRGPHAFAAMPTRASPRLVANSNTPDGAPLRTRSFLAANTARLPSGLQFPNKPPIARLGWAQVAGIVTLHDVTESIYAGRYPDEKFRDQVRASGRRLVSPAVPSLRQPSPVESTALLG